MNQPLMRLQGVSCAFGNNLALDSVSIEVQPGEITCLLGDNGAGKSTLIKIMSGVQRPTGGTIEFEGRPVRFESPRDAQLLGIGTVHQDVGLIPLISVARNFFLQWPFPPNKNTRSAASAFTTSKTCSIP